MFEHVKMKFKFLRGKQFIKIVSVHYVLKLFQLSNGDSISLVASLQQLQILSQVRTNRIPNLGQGDRT